MRFYRLSTLRSLRLPALLSWASGIAALASCAEQPPPDCRVLSTPYAAKWIELDLQESASGACAAIGGGGYDSDPTLGASTYWEPNAKGQPDYARSAIALRTAEFAALIAGAAELGVTDTATDRTQYAFGKFATPTPDAADMCHVPQLSPAHLVLDPLPAVPDDPETPDSDESTPAQPAVDIELQWSNVNVYVTAAVLGSQFSAELTDTRRSEGQVCSIHYRVLALAPAVSCKKLLPDGKTVDRNPDGTFKPDESLCDPNPDPANQRATGSGIVEGADYMCDSTSFYCVIRGDSVPALRVR
jgi:hypothetical protein